jgi:gluconolactonase
VLERSGDASRAKFAGQEPGSSGTALDAQGRLVLCEHGDRRITRLERDGSKKGIADRFEGHRLNRPNDLTFAKNGDLYFTDPPLGLPGAFRDPAKELPYQGVYRVRGGVLELLIRDLTAPNDVALSPDERTLYVSHADQTNPLWIADPLDAAGKPAGAASLRTRATRSRRMPAPRTAWTSMRRATCVR